MGIFADVYVHFIQAPDMEALAAELARHPPRSGSCSTRSGVSSTAEQTPDVAAIPSSIGSPETPGNPKSTSPEHSETNSLAAPEQAEEVTPSPITRELN